MADPSTYRPRPGEIPVDPGVYRFRDAHGRVIYVGKAKSLRSAAVVVLPGHLGAAPAHRARWSPPAASVEWTVVGNEVEALQLEYSWIKEFDPRFNVKYRDDKSYPYLAVTMGEEFPRAQVHARRQAQGHPLLRALRPRLGDPRDRSTCCCGSSRCAPAAPGVFKRAGQVGRPCLLGYIDKCSAPCVGRVDAEEHRAIAEDFCDFMAGNTGRFVKRLERG